MAESKAYVVSDDKRSEQDVRKENTQLVNEIVSYCSQLDYKKHNVLLIGQSGSGKSSIINTLLKVIIGQYFQRAKAGRGHVLKSCTLQLKCYKNCGAKDTDFKRNEEQKKRQNQIAHGISDIPTLLSAVLTKLPDIFDAAGMDNLNDENTKEMLRLLLGGHIPPNTSIAGLGLLRERNGLGYLPMRYRSSKNEYKMSMVIFVCSCTSPIPYNLIKCVQEVLQEVDPNTLLKKYDTDVFVLLTKYDKVLGDVSADSTSNTTETPNDPEEDNEGNKSESTIALDQFKIVQRKITEAFIQIGTATHSQLYWASYNDTTGYDNVYVDNKALKLLKVLTTPLHMDEAPPLNNLTDSFIKLLVDIYFGICRALGQDIKLYSILILFLLIIVLVLSQLSVSVTGNILPQE